MRSIFNLSPKSPPPEGGLCAEAHLQNSPPPEGGGKYRLSFSLILALICWSSIALAAPQHGIAMHGDLKYPADFQHFTYVNKGAPKGGTLRLADLGTFDSLNPFILKGAPAAGLNMMGQGLVYESLMTKSDDEPFSMYGLIAESIDVAPDRSSVTFKINKSARWHDDTPITATDVKWTFETMMDKGTPFFKSYFADVGAVTTPDHHTVTFAIKNKDNRELPLVLGEMVVLPHHFWTAPGRDITQASLDLPLGSGPYKIGNVKPGAQIEYVRAPNWWGRDLPVNRGRYNFDRLTYDYYRDHNVALEAFFAGAYDVRLENVAKLWASAYTAPPVRDGRIIKAEIPHTQPVGMQGFIFNTRRPVFADKQVRAALNFAFDYEWANKQLADSAYTRTDSYFENSDLGVATPQPTTDGTGNNRANLKRAAQMLEAAGYTLGKDGVRVNKAGTRLEFEYIDANPALERWVNPFLQNLKKIGVIGRLRTIDPTQYQNRMNDFDFDMTTAVIGQSDSPGNEQRDYWASDKADVKGGRNYMGVRDPAVDALIDQIIGATTRDDLRAATQKLDQTLMQGHYLIPNWHYPKWRVAWWAGFDHPKIENTKSLGVLDTWWKKP